MAFSCLLYRKIALFSRRRSRSEGWWWKRCLFIRRRWIICLSALRWGIYLVTGDSAYHQNDDKYKYKPKKVTYSGSGGPVSQNISTKYLWIYSECLLLSVSCWHPITFPLCLSNFIPIASSVSWGRSRGYSATRSLY